VRNAKKRTGGALGVVLEVLALGDELVLGRGKAALGRGPELRGSARGGASESGGEHCCVGKLIDCREVSGHNMR
jgi:hypothetical protein